jgi:calcineurin-like phosphoesterase family protein
VTRFWTADPHIGHRNIIKYAERPFKDLDHMHSVIRDRWNSTVMPDDTVVICGDLALGPIENLQFFKQLNGQKLVIAGNHDRMWRGNKWEYRQRYHDAHEDAGLQFASYGEPIDCGWIGEPADQVFVASHFPYDSDERHGDRFAEWYPKDEGKFLVHGHVHTSWVQRGRQINVGMDVRDFTPVSDDELRGLMV